MSDFGGVRQNVSAGVAPLERDSVEISAEKKIKEANKSGLSTGAKWALGILGSAATIYGCVVGHRMLNKPTLEKVQKNFSEIFRRDVTKEEAEKLAKQYKEIFKINDTDEFCTKMFEQVKKDYGLEKANISLKIDKLVDGNLSSFIKSHERGLWSPNRGEFTILPLVPEGKPLTESTKKEIFSTVIHEFQHVKQSEIAYRTSSNEFAKAIKTNLENDNIIKSFKALLNDSYKLKQFAKKENCSVEEIKETVKKGIKVFEENELKHTYNAKEIEEKLEKVFGHLPKLGKESPEYQLGLKYIKNKANYIDAAVDYKGYTEQLLEKEAFGTEPKAKEIYRYFGNPWSVF